MEKSLKEKGFVLIDANLVEEINLLQAFIHKNFDLSFSDFYYSLLSNSYDKNMVLRDFIKDVLKRFYEKNFDSYRTLTESFLAKPANTSNEFLLHQDWCYTDETQNDAYNIWIPLEDVTKENGAMVFLAGSHKWFGNIRSSTLPTARISSQYFLGKGAETVEMKKGQALVFHPAVFHGSGPNLSDHNRIVVTATVMPEKAAFLYFQKNSETKVNVLHPQDDFFLRDLHSLAVGGDASLPTESRIEYVYKVITEADLRSRFDEGMSRHPY